MEIVQPIPTRAKIARAWLEHAHSFDRCVGSVAVQPSHKLEVARVPVLGADQKKSGLWRRLKHCNMQKLQANDLKGNFFILNTNRRPKELLKHE